MKGVFNLIKREKLKKSLILFSPCAASFDSFKNFEDRGHYFNQLIKNNLMESKIYYIVCIIIGGKMLINLYFLIVLLFLIGLFFSLVSTSLIVSDKLDTNDYSFFFKHLVFVFLGIILILFFPR